MTITQKEWNEPNTSNLDNDGFCYPLSTSHTPQTNRSHHNSGGIVWDFVASLKRSYQSRVLTLCPVLWQSWQSYCRFINWRLPLITHRQRRCWNVSTALGKGWWGKPAQPTETLRNIYSICVLPSEILSMLELNLLHFNSILGKMCRGLYVPKSQ